MSGEVGILNVGAGDVKLTFDKSNPAECIRAARIVKDMLRRGYALLVEVEGKDGKKAYQRVQDFDENVYEYIVADFDPITAEQADREEAGEQEKDTAQAPRVGAGRRRRLKATDTKAVAVARSAGG